MLKIDYATGTADADAVAVAAGGSSADFTSEAKISRLLHKSCTVPRRDLQQQVNKQLAL